MSSGSRTLETIYIHSLLSEVPSYLILPLFHTDTSQSTESVDDESSPPLNSTVITAVTSGVATFACILLLAAICFCVIMLRKRTLKQESKVLQHRTTVSKQEGQGPHYEEIALQRPHYEEIQVQNYHIYYTLEPDA